MIQESADPLELLKHAWVEQDALSFRTLLDHHPELKAKLNEPVEAFNAPLITRARSREMLDVLLDAGADINAKSRWWAGGFGLLHGAKPELAAYAIQRGAVVDVHAAARLGMLPRLRELVSADPALVHARGGDGQTPLHFASTIAVAEFLIDHGADIDARDIDHESTPAQYMVKDRQDVLRYLIQRGCKTDLLMAAAIGDVQLVSRCLDAEPECIRLRVNEDCFPMSNKKAGGIIYNWTLGWHVSPHEVAKQFGHHDVFHLLMRGSPPDVRLLVACWLGDEPKVKDLLAADPGLKASLRASSSAQIAHAARNNNLGAVRLMLEAGLPADATGQHDGTPLHWACFHGNAGMARRLLRFHPPLETLDRDFQAAPLGWAIHGSEHGWYCRTGDFASTVEALLQAGAKPPKKSDGSPAVRAVLRSHGVAD